MKKAIIIFLALIVVSNLNFDKYKKQIEFLNKKQGSHNKEFAILIDYSKHSSRDRMFLINLKTKEIVNSFKVAHGRGKNKYLSLTKKFSNERGSNLSSLGVSVLESKNNSSWGLGFNYTIKGLDSTNNNNVSRNIVLHSWGGIQDFWMYPIPLPQSQGCPTVSNNTLKYLNNFIKKQKNKKILIYTIGNG
jgi:hypothetical protein